MPTRMLRDWSDSAKFDGITAEAERLFMRLIMKADDYGRFHAEPRLVRSLCFPLLDTLRTEHIGRWLDELSDRNLVFRYENEHQKLLAIVNFGQRLRDTKAKFPPPAGEPDEWLPPACGNSRQSAATCGWSRPEEKGSRSRSRSRRDLDLSLEPGAGAPPAAAGESEFAQFWAEYPRKKEKGEAENAWAKTKRPDIATILAAVRAQKRSHDWTKENGEFIPYPAKWITRKGWEDDAGAPVNSNNGPAKRRQLNPEWSPPDDRWLARVVELSPAPLRKKNLQAQIDAGTLEWSELDQIEKERLVAAFPEYSPAYAQ
jgi:hypothetical protein